MKPVPVDDLLTNEAPLLRFRYETRFEVRGLGLELVYGVKPLKNIHKQGPMKPNKGKHKISQRPT